MGIFYVIFMIGFLLLISKRFDLMGKDMTDAVFVIVSSDVLMDGYYRKRYQQKKPA